MYAGIATQRPAAVQTSASPMPPAIFIGSPTPEIMTAKNMRMRPNTVPRRPSKGPISAIVPVHDVAAGVLDALLDDLARPVAHRERRGHELAERRVRAQHLEVLGIDL